MVDLLNFADIQVQDMDKIVNTCWLISLRSDREFDKELKKQGIEPAERNLMHLATVFKENGIMLPNFKSTNLSRTLIEPLRDGSGR